MAFGNFQRNFSPNSQSQVMRSFAKNVFPKKHPVINFGYEPNWPPYEIYENGVYTGISGDYIKMIELHTDIEMVPIPNITWQETISGLEQGNIKVAALAGITQERKKYINFTDPHIIDPLVIVTQTGYKFINFVTHLTILI